MIIHNFPIAQDYKSFLSFGGVYVEPSQQPKSCRLMVYLDEALSLYTGVPYKLPNVLPSAMPSAALNGSL